MHEKDNAESTPFKGLGSVLLLPVKVENAATCFVFIAIDELPSSEGSPDYHVTPPAISAVSVEVSIRVNIDLQAREPEKGPSCH